MHADRRTFLLASSSAVTAAFASSSLFGGPNDQVNVGLIGCGGRGPNDADKARDNSHVALTHVCDPDDGRRALAAKRYDVSESRSVRDMRVLFEHAALVMSGSKIAGTGHWTMAAAQRFIPGPTPCRPPSTPLRGRWLSARPACPTARSERPARWQRRTGRRTTRGRPSPRV